MTAEAESLARAAAEFADDKKAIDIRVLDLREIASFTDFFVICSGGSDRQIKAIQDGIREGLRERFGRSPERVDGEREARWVLIDYGDCMIHVMTAEAREFYRLRQPWGGAPGGSRDRADRARRAPSGHPPTREKDPAWRPARSSPGSRGARRWRGRTPTRCR